eukprot:scaffold1355_cov268-Pinguiococcus_pyrenoidosus.AAC.31
MAKALHRDAQERSMSCRRTWLWWRSTAAWTRMGCMTPSGAHRAALRCAAMLTWCVAHVVRCVDLTSLALSLGRFSRVSSTLDPPSERRGSPPPVSANSSAPDLPRSMWFAWKSRRM